MKVEMEHTTSMVGMFKSAPAIKLTVQFSDEEIAIIKKAGLSNYAYYEAPITRHMKESMQAPALVSQLIKGKPSYHIYDDESKARSEEARLKDGLKNLKAAIEDNSKPLSGKNSFEL